MDRPVLTGAIALDVDGTLLTSDQRITPATRHSIAAARAAGIAVVLASARGPRGLAPLIAELGLDDPVIGFGGALVWEPGPDGAATVLSEARLPADVARAIVLDAESLGLEVGWYVGGRWLVGAIGPAVVDEGRLTEETAEVCPVLERRPPPHKLMCMADRATAGALLEVRDRMPPPAHGVLSNWCYLEVTAAGVGKGRAFTAVLRRLGVPVERSAAIGDGENDIELLRLAGHGIAMGHAPASVRAAADAVTADNDHDGVAIALGTLLSDGFPPRP